MHLQVKKIILWPRNTAYDPRVLPFYLGVVNVISGVSKTGKSAIIPIVDYCLGADKCAIPVKTIRDACAWFGVVFETVQGELLLARREPGNQKSTGDMFVLQGTTVMVPNRIDGPNSTVEFVKGTLNDLAGLTDLEFDSGSGFKGRPSFRDMVAFVFQPQNIVANPNVLFYKADSTEHREKLRTILPYVLGAVSARALSVDQDLQRTRLDLRRKERELSTSREVSARWLADASARASRAYEFGLLARMPSETASLNELVAALRVAANASASPAGDSPSLSSTRINAAAEELVALQREEALISSELSQLKQRVGDMVRFREATSDYRGSLTIRRDRLEVSEWIGALFEKDHACPLCGTADTPILAEVEELRSALRRVEEQADDIAQVPVAFEREYQRVREDLNLQTDRLNAARIRRRALENASAEAKTKQYLVTEAARFAGGLEEALKRYDQLTADGELVGEVSELRERVAGLESLLREINISAALGRAGERFSALVARILPNLDIERPNDPVKLVLADLTLQIVGEDRDDYLWEIGSGANWLSYHIAASVALHQLFQRLPTSPVPTFAVYDQPSQVYFPKKTSEAASDVQISSSDESRRDEDIAAVRQVFQVLAQAANDSKGAWQAIVLDHAAANVWGGIQGIQLVEEWRGGDKLVPDTWLR